MTLSPASVTGIVLSPLVAGPLRSAPDAASNWLPWTGQMITSPAGSCTCRPWCGQVGSKATTWPALGWVSRTFPPAGPLTSTPPPTGMSANVASGPVPRPDGGPLAPLDGGAPVPLDGGT